ncbi:TIGR03767 family metallophosphoesterase [Beutenbergia cavernae]|uniref:TIGR03767 family metallophosphoesterase n=1 Tax=Beutenbergia cavernae TaxID=84757 RepID=UPI00019AD40F|nr:TIGR03767 family metallophosphoesterase [Beutenbergia cavernae]
MPGPGEPHLARRDLLPAAEGRLSENARSGSPRSVAYLAHLTDVQLLDVQSPSRLEAVHRFGCRADTRLLLPMQRPQEVLAAHATEALVRAINAAGRSPLTGAELQLAFTTGDNVDNMQLNEVRAFLRLMSGGEVRMDSGGPAYEGVQDGRFEWAWAPDDPANDWGRAHGYPTVPGLVAAGLRPFRATGLSVPWLSCFGNHDGLVQGRVPNSEELTAISVGNRKVIDVEEPFGDFFAAPASFFAGRAERVTADADRRGVPRAEFVGAHAAAVDGAHSHGFTERNVADGTAYYAYDGIPGLRIVTLDTTNPAGGFEGSIDSRQLAWLREALEEVHDAAGRAERLVVVTSHHPRTSMTNDLAVPAGQPDAGRRVLGEEVAALLHRYPGVVAWVTGHVHVHRVRPCHPPAGAPGNGFWEITTASVMEWPSQVRLLEIVDDGAGSLAVVSTVLDHDAAARPDGLASPLELAAWHRELAANDPGSVGGFDAEGAADDRNVELWLPDPR